MFDLFWMIAILVGMLSKESAVNNRKIPINPANFSGVLAKAALNDKFNWKPLQYDTTKQYIYLSFDDGPQQGTMECVKLLKQEGIKASFFMVGLHVGMRSDGNKLVSYIRNSYPQFLLANHSFSHAYNHYQYFYHHPNLAEHDFEKAQQKLNIPYKIARLPGNRSWVRANEIKASGLVFPVAHLLDSAGYNIIGWDLEWRFNHSSAKPVQSAAEMAAQVDSAFARGNTHTPHHLVILSHDRMFHRPADADSLAKFIRLLKQNPRFVFETVDHYPGIKKPLHTSM